MKYWLLCQNDFGLPLRFNDKEKLRKYWKSLPKDVEVKVIEFEKVYNN